MVDELRHRSYGLTVEEWIALVPGELAVDAVGLWQIISAGRQGFDLSGDGLTEYVRRNIYALLGKGAKPVVVVRNAIQGRGWSVVDYGDAPEQIANAAIAEWQREGPDSTPMKVWFALPSMWLPT